MASNPFSAPMLFSMAMSCNEAIQAARMEIARAVAVGSYQRAPNSAAGFVQVCAHTGNV